MKDVLPLMVQGQKARNSNVASRDTIPIENSIQEEISNQRNLLTTWSGLQPFSFEDAAAGVNNETQTLIFQILY